MVGVKRERSSDPEEEDQEGCYNENDQDDEVPWRRSGAGAGPSAADAAGARTTFAKGAVKLIRVHDFMTYSGTVIIRPGPRLNLVLGPNGTGKSSLVCALCIGLNGSPKSLGRADNLAEFVRRGAHSCWIEITLSCGGEGRDYVVKRSISSRNETEEDGRVVKKFTSKWAVNGRETTAKEVDKLVKTFNIQFDNLCQFLPQDRVAEFARMNPLELLAATEKALGDSSLYDQHQQLVQLRDEEKRALGEHDANQKRLEKLKAEQERQRREYERFQLRERLLEEARAFRCQAKWLEVHAKKEAKAAAHKRVVEARGELAGLQSQQQEDMRPITMREALIKDIRQERVAAERAARDLDKRNVRMSEKLQKHLGLYYGRNGSSALIPGRAQSIYSGMTAQPGTPLVYLAWAPHQEQDTHRLADELGTLDAQARKRRDDIAAAQDKLRRAQEELQQVPDRPPQELHDRMHELRESISNGRTEYSEKQAERNNIAGQMQAKMAEICRVRDQIDTLNSRKYQMLQRLGQVNRNIGNLHAWIEEHRSDGTFRGPVFGPIALEINMRAVPDLPPALALQYVENTCWSWLGSYIVTCKEDEMMLAEQIKTFGVFGIKAAMCAHNPDEPYDMHYPSGPAAQHAAYGLTHTVDELFTAPPIVMFLLAGQCRVNQVYIGTQQAVRCMENMARETSISTVLVGGSRHGVLRSRYAAGQRAIEDKPLYALRLLAGGGGLEEEQRLAGLQAREQQLAQERDGLQAQSDDLGRQLQELEQQMMAWDQEGLQLKQRATAIQTRRVNLIGAVQTAERTLRNKEAVPDPEARRPALRQDLEQRLEQHAGLVRQVLETMQASWAAAKEVLLLELRSNEVAAQVAALKAGQDARASALRAAKTAVTDAEAAFTAAEEQYRASKDAATEHYPRKESDIEEIKRHIEAKTSRAALLEGAEKKEAEADEVNCSNQNVVKEFRKRQADIDALMTSGQALEAEIQRLQSKLAEVKESWLPCIKDMVETINESFSANFGEIGCAGEVRLHEDEDFTKYAIHIMVQFRADEELQLLNSHRQSGGERSATTVLYLIALQNVTETSFRVVDEINQGMDAINERKVFHQLVVASTAADTPQCFLLTPKLLPNLPYTGDITVLGIYSGCHIDAGVQPSMAITVRGRGRG
ncbi:hypothetical protein GPECTOR_38g278 [Gonium pectorale]|uniref:Structural maintenance of chromosomes protein 5 n=1 Tax=Gonium pectorale TaxID=33097 RepID=A0A150GB09_GONPE|nr:hypothetical protein GPECTOR_38g278 [Gonium pectorale]|eukprot:KXZ47041.1 hypothetical protein GPECTOR_38g278 [Gonium pectorale]